MRRKRTGTIMDADVMTDRAPRGYEEFVRLADEAGMRDAIGVLGTMDSGRKYVTAAKDREGELGKTPGWVDASLDSIRGFDDVEMMCGNLASWMYSATTMFHGMDGRFPSVLATTAEIMRASGYCGPSAGLALTLLTSPAAPGIPFTSAKESKDDGGVGEVFQTDDQGRIFLNRTPPALASLLQSMCGSMGLPASFIIESCIHPLIVVPGRKSLPARRGLLRGRAPLETMTLMYFKTAMHIEPDDGDYKTDLLPMPITIDSMFDDRRPDIESWYGRGCEWLYKEKGR